MERQSAFRAFHRAFQRKLLRDLTVANLHAFLEEYRQDRNVTDRTLNRVKTTLNHFFRWLEAEEILRQNPMLSIRYREQQPPRRVRVVLSKDEIKTILRELRQRSPELYPFVLAAVHTGARLSELLGLTWRRVDFENGLVHLDTGKTGKVRSLRMTDGLRGMLAGLDRSLGIDGRVFTRESGGRRVPLSKTKVADLQRGFRSVSSVRKDWTMHSIRHSFAYHFLRDGGGMHQLQAILGHSSIKVTVDTYGQLEAADAGKLHPFG